MKSKIRIETTTCRRCGKNLTTFSRSLWGLNDLKEKFGRICSDCVTADEDFEMNRQIGKSIAETGGEK